VKFGTTQGSKGVLAHHQELDFVVDLLEVFRTEDNPFEVIYQVRKRTEARYYEIINST
jgi:hypothetical protein